MLKRTVIDQIEITRDGTIQLRMAKAVVDDDGTVLSSGWHRTIVPPDGDVDLQMQAVNSHLVMGLGYPAVAAADIERVKAIIPVVHTKKVRDDFAAKVEAARVKESGASKTAK